MKIAILSCNTGGGHNAAAAALAEETPLERLGTPEDVAQAIWFLASPAGDFFTGQVLAPNGGFII